MPTLESFARAAIATIALTTAALAQGDFLYTVTNSDDQLRTVDLATGGTTSSVTMSTGTSSPTQCNGLTRDPTTGVLYLAARFPSSNARQLATVDPTSGACVIIGQLSERFAGLACRIDGTLYGVTGDGANTPETLYTIDKATAASTLVTALGNGNDGETIAFADDLLLYHASGLGAPNVDEVFETIDTFGTNTLTNVPLAGFDYDELTALTSFTGGNLLGVDLDDELVTIATAGHVTRLATLDHGTVKGMVWIPSTNTQAFFRQYGTGCATTAGAIPLLYGSGTPQAGMAVRMHLLNAPTTSFGVLAFGSSTGTLPLPSPTCQAQINPVFVTGGFFTGAAGEANFGLSLPSPFAPIDIYIQVGVIDGSNFVVSNPLQMHTQ
ncbi:MAG: hypothetical protein NXI31_17760 [bacterium]|nr:hypothetical protein [bacterium]